MPHTNKWLCLYSICQLGRPYWYATSGQIATDSLYSSCVTANKYYYANYQSQLGQKVHDCSGLIGGALTCEGVDAPPTLSNPLNNQSSMFNADCSKHSETMDDFPYIPGTIVFHSSGSSKTHVGIYVGEFIDRDGNNYTNTVVEAMGHDWGVVTSSLSNSRWDSWGQLDCCTIDTKQGERFDARNIGGTGGTITINTESMNPFIATLPPTTSKKLDYDKIKDARISGMSFFAGELFDNSHIQKTYMNPHLPELIQPCNDSGLPYALYVNVRAKNEIEADAECRSLYYILAKFPPVLGIWLSLKTYNSNDMNDSILEIYYKFINKWGLGQRCGFYIEKDILDKFTWTKFQDRFYLWLIDPMDVTKVDDELLQPEMFEVAD